MRMTNSSSPLPTWARSCGRPVRAAHRPLPRYPNASPSMTVYRTLPWPSTSVAAHLLLPGAGCRHIFLALPYYASRALADGHGRQLYVRPRRIGSRHHHPLRLAPGTAAGSAHGLSLGSDTVHSDILCSNPLPAVNTGATGGGKYAYNDGDGSTAYDVEYPSRSRLTPISILWV